MGKQDDELRWYLNKDSVFADFCNGVIYDGKKVIFPHELAEVQRNYQEGLQDRRGKRRAESAKAGKGYCKASVQERRVCADCG